MEPETANMPDDQNADKLSADLHSAAGEKPPRSKLERALVWTAIGFLLILTGLEALSQYGYRKTLSSLEDAIAEAKEPLTLEDFNNGIRKGLPIVTNGERGEEKTILYKWPSLLRRYELHLTTKPGAEQILNTYSTGDGPGALIGTSKAAGDSEDAEEGGPGMPMAGGPGGGPGGGGPGGGRRGPPNPLQRLLSEPVQPELQLSEEQKTQIEDLIESQTPDPMQDLSPEERAQQAETQRKDAMARLKEILDEKQFTRARQIMLHARGPEALTQEDVAEELKLTDEQREQIAAIITTLREKRQEIRQKVESGEIERGEVREKMAELRTQANEQALAVLKDDQKQAWEKLLGPAPPEPERGPRGQ